jgi:DNA-binding transcriptional ArsR family regulator
MSRRSSAAPVFAALGDETRLELVGRLSSKGPLSIARLAEGSTVTRQAITKHLEVLAGAGLVTAKKRGRERIFAIHADGLISAQAFLERVSARWDEATERLRKLVEEP